MQTEKPSSWKATCDGVNQKKKIIHNQDEKITEKNICIIYYTFAILLYVNYFANVLVILHFEKRKKRPEWERFPRLTNRGCDIWPKVRRIDASICIFMPQQNTTYL